MNRLRKVPGFRLLLAGLLVGWLLGGCMIVHHGGMPGHHHAEHGDDD